MDAESNRGRTLEAYRQGPEAVVGLVVELVAGFAVQLEALSTRVAGLEVENAALRLENAALQAENAALRARLGTDSHPPQALSLIHISEPTRLGMISYAVFCLK